MSDSATPYRGRFAPTPSGPLHFGSLVAALGSWMQARAAGGEWLVRMEDLDPPREMAGAADAILRSLEAHGLAWDGPVVYQSGRGEFYSTVFEELDRLGLLYGCACTRKEINEGMPRGAYGPVYSGRCRHGVPPGREPRALRVRVEGAELGFADPLQGWFSQHLEREVGDFVVRRADGLTAYQLAVVVDDAEQGVSEVVRGSDLLDSTPRQLYLQRVLGLPRPGYLHLPVATNRDGQKWSKQSHAPPLDDGAPTAALIAAWRFLGQPPFEADPREATPEAFLAWGAARWQCGRIPARLSIETALGAKL
ncbi:tRNA glutamyl-Q(34) synthetase GluQRS [Endothiovibrio diazotrophicus]